MCFTNLVSGDFLDPKIHHEELEYFHKEFYLAFQNLPQKLLQKIWIIDYDNKKIYFKASENNVRIMPYVINNKIHSFFAFQPHIPENYIQYVEFGFPFQYNFKSNTIEALTIFNTSIVNSNRTIPKVHVGRDFIEKIVAPKLRSMNYFTCFATCTENLLRFYLMGGFTKLGQNEIDGQKRYLIKKV